MSSRGRTPMTRDAALRVALRAALAMHPDRPGVGRPCQELLAEITGEPITAPTYPQVQLSRCGAHLIGKAGTNPWGRKGKPELNTTRGEEP